MAPSRPLRSLPVLTAAAALGAALGFAAFTGHAWEDYFITFRSSLNLATGHGLVYQPGERVHSFTSPLGTLLPALFALGGGDGAALRALWLLRIVSAAALAAGVGLAARRALRDGVAPLAAGAGCALCLLDPKIVDFSVNGMETGLLVFFVFWTWRALTGEASLRACAFGCAGLQWTRPDGCVFFAALALAWLVFGERAAGPPFRRRVVRVAQAAALGLALYLPWLAFAWWYFGSPIPHTIVAKISPHAPGELVRALALYPWRLLAGGVALHDLFQPAYFYLGGWPRGVGLWSRLLATGAALAWLVPGVRPAGRVAAAALFLGGFYVEFIPRSPWYAPGWEALACLAWIHLLDAGLRAGARHPAALSAVRVAAGVVVLAQAGLLGATAWEMRVQQRIVEEGGRREIGRWLRANAGAGDRVFLEPLGYIGFYSGLKMLDYPGLASPEVVAARRAGRRSFAQIVAALQPDWLVLRPDEVEGMRDEAPALFARTYRLARVFDVRPALARVVLLPGRGYPEFDAVFDVYRRVGS